MKKALTLVLSIFRGLRLYFILTVDRFIMSPFAGVDLPSMHYDRNLPKIDENTTDKDKLKITNQSRDNKYNYINGYYKKARKRARIATEIVIVLYLLNWLIF